MRLLHILAAASLSLAESTFISALNACPAPCDTLEDSVNWTAYKRVERLAACNETMLLDFSLYSSLDSPKATRAIYACLPDTGPATKRELLSTTCDAKEQKELALEFASSGPEGSESSSKIIAALEQVKRQLESHQSCEDITSFGYSQRAAVGIYVGGGVHHGSIADSLIPKLLKHIRDNGASEKMAIQYCGVDADYTIGIVADAKNGLPGVQKAVKQWSEAKCVTGYESTSEWKQIPLKLAGSMVRQEATGSKHFARGLIKRDTCKYIKVVSGDSCRSLAKKCGISGADFDKYNDDPDTCSSLAAGQAVCCSKGELPDLKPKPNPDGTCATHTIVANDNCDKIAAANGLKVDELKGFNKRTWAWAGCDSLIRNSKICVSKGNPPMPQPISNAVCGPQVPGTKQPTDDTELEDLNPCKLNACCDIWGQCGVTAEFCTETGENRCISNCGTDVVNKEKPDNKVLVGYFEAWNWDRPCLQQDLNTVDVSIYTHIHFAFAGISDDFDVDISEVERQFAQLKELKDVNRILSFGGWSFSTELDTYPIFRQGVTDANRQKFADNVVDFITEHDLDGVDFDWEYPGAPDIPGIPAGSEEDGANYVKFLKMVREKLPDGKSLSIAAPASYWYLRGFDPITDFEPLLDYMIYMSYDLHGQWDYGNEWAVPGCPEGNCLRSHVNMTETLTSMSMITKAGMPTGKLVMGTALYGRSFKMTKAGCTGPMCTFVGPESKAAKGRCTGEPGYISLAEINEILDKNPTAKTWYDDDSQSDIMVYNETEWVSYMGENAHGERLLGYLLKYQMAGYSDWAVDLGQFFEFATADYKPCDGDYDSLQAIKDDMDNIQDHCIEVYAIDILGKRLQTALDKYSDLLEDGYDDKFKTYEKYTTESVWAEIDAYMMEHADDHWTCIENAYVTCCSDCSVACECEFCDGGESGYRNKTVSCPTSVPPITGSGDAQTIYWQLDDEDGFYKDIADGYGVLEQWITFEPRQVGSPIGCGPVDDYDCGHWWFGYPERKDEIDVPNPKDMISSAMTNLTIVSDMLAGAALDSYALSYVGSTADVVTASELPVFMSEFAVDSMQEVADAAEEIEEADKKAMILNFVMAILMIVPAVGEAAGSIGLTTIGRIITLTGVTGNAAFGVYGVVEDPKSAIVSLFIALVGLRGELGFSKAAEVRRGMSSKEIAVLGKAFKQKSDLLHSIQKTCKT